MAPSKIGPIAKCALRVSSSASSSATSARRGASWTRRNGDRRIRRYSRSRVLANLSPMKHPLFDDPSWRVRRGQLSRSRSSLRRS